LTRLLVANDSCCNFDLQSCTNVTVDYKDRNLGQSTLFIDRQSTQRAVNNNGLLLLSSRLLKLHTSNKWSLVLSPDGIHQSHSKSKQEIRHFSTRQY
jgi:hypothetical protein